MALPTSSLPRSYLIKQCKEDLNQICHITRTPGVAEGAELDFDTELETVIQQQVSFVNIYTNKVNHATCYNDVTMLFFFF